MIRGDQLPNRAYWFVLRYYLDRVVTSLTFAEWLEGHMFDVETPGVVRIKTCACTPECQVTA